MPIVRAVRVRSCPFWADELFVTSVTASGARRTDRSPSPRAFQAQDGEPPVDRFYQAAPGPWRPGQQRPGERVYHLGYTPPLSSIPDGNNIKAVYHGEAKRNYRIGVEIRF